MSGFSPAFERLGAALAAVVLQQQETLAEFLPREDWSADLTARTYSSGGVTVRVSLLGSYAARERTWLWGWANPQFGDAHPAVTPTLVIRTVGERLGITEFTTPEVDLSWYEGPAGHGGELMAMAAGGVLGGAGYIGAGYDGGSAYLHVDDPQAPPAQWDPIPLPRILASATSLFPHEPRLTLAGFLSRHRVPYRQTDLQTEALLPGGATARARFDGLGRFVDWHSELMAAHSSFGP
ncbi:hypothetical protein E1287_03440 [Actinomadura sp. KC06]|uniref:DUF6882 domain-containing protein n=1 Tax=Actinomadura sp. KC06 TaxID=2530369 RepID=UPI0010520672|nr:DUF6882 domain-containing protein [Actinomadura sp. KC06]TDD39494.1 hypothetical protein E1287_03440 [Actinomadura sp. KC06]